MPIFYAVLPEGAEITGTDFCSSRLHTAFTLLAYMCFLRYVLSCCTALWWKLELLFIIYAAFLENIYFAPVHVLNAHHPTVQNFHKIFTSKHHNVPHVGHITLQSVWLRTFRLMAESFFILKCIKKKEQNEPKNEQININRAEQMHQCCLSTACLLKVKLNLRKARLTHTTALRFQLNFYRSAWDHGINNHPFTR